MIRSLVTAAVVLATVPAASAAQQPAAAPAGPVIKNPNWIKKPSGRDLAAVWPAEARVRGINGRAVIACEVTAEGTLRACGVVSETPRGAGYGFAALALAPQFRMSPQTVDGAPVSGAIVRIPVTFETGGPQSAATTSREAAYLVSPDWTAAPTHAQVAAVYPAGSLKKGAAGRATLDCAVTPEGGLRACTVADESPRVAGFGWAAKQLSGFFRVPPVKDAQGALVKNARVRVPVVFSPAAAKGDSRIVKPEWGRLPDAAAVDSLYPPAAKAAKATGAVTVECRVAAGGALTNCNMLRETPGDLGFGQAALALTKHFRMRAWTSDGRPVDGALVRIPVRYENP